MRLYKGFREASTLNDIALYIFIEYNIYVMRINKVISHLISIDLQLFELRNVPLYVPL